MIGQGQGEICVRNKKEIHPQETALPSLGESDSITTPTETFLKSTSRHRERQRAESRVGWNKKGFNENSIKQIGTDSTGETEWSPL